MGLIFDPATRPAPGVPGADLHRLLLPPLLRVAELHPDHRGGDRGLRGGLGVLRRGLHGRDPRQHGAPSSTRPTRLEPRFNQAFVEYAQDRGFADRPGPGAPPQGQAQGRADRALTCAARSSPARTSSTWPTPSAGPRSGVATRPGCGSTAPPRCRPAELFAARGGPGLLPVPVAPYDLPIYATPKVHRDHHIEVARALYSVPGNLIGRRVEVRADSPAGAGLLPRRSWSRSIPARHRAGAHRPRRPAGGEDRLRPARPRPPAPLGRRRTAPPSAPTRRRCWTTRCRGPRCARSTRCWAWSRSGARARRGRLRPGAEAEAVSVGADRPDDRAGHREPAPSRCRPGRLLPARFARPAATSPSQRNPATTSWTDDGRSRRHSGGAA